MQESLFTKIIKGEIPSYALYEDDRTYAFLDIHPVQPGHTLVIPKVQVEFLWDLSDEDYAAVMATAKQLGLHIRQVLNVPYVGAKVIGEEVPHAHVHLIPFHTAQEISAAPSAEPDHEALAEMARKLSLEQ